MIVAFNPEYLHRRRRGRARATRSSSRPSTRSSRRCCGRPSGGDFLYLLMPVRVP